jgi:dTDP-4-amino-4,6-dideoxygalactose transaminase
LLRSTSSVAALSGRLEEWFQVERAVLVGRAALGLLMALRVWRAARPRCRVAIPGAICQEVLLAVLLADCEPIFCDVNVADGLVPDSEWARARSLGADVAIVAHLYGNPAQTMRIRSIFPAPDNLLIDDAAQALGSRTEDGICGSLGDIGLLSFGYSKQISVGNGAVLVRDPEFAAQIEAALPALAAPNGQSRSELQKAFRSKLDAARERLIATENPDARGFAGLLQGLDWMLKVPYDESLTAAIVTAIDRYSENAAARIEKAGIWRRSFEGSGLLPVGMGSGCVPWRFVCRLPGIDWRTQARLAESIRKHGIHVSTWYLPANWFRGQLIGILPGVEMLSREVFQLWLDEDATSESIADNAQLIRRELARFGQFGSDL